MKHRLSKHGEQAITQPPSDYRFLVFNAFLFLAGMGGMFFRMARDNDDIVRAGLILVTGSALTFLLATARLHVPLTLALPCLGWACSVFLSSLATVNAGESLKEFLKTGIYLLLVLTLASTALRPVGSLPVVLRRKVPIVLAVLGVLLGWIHAYGLFGIPKLKLWTDSQVIASISTVLLLGAAFTLALARGTVRQSILRGLIVMAVISCTLGILQFYHLDPLRPWDPRQPYNIYVRDLPADLLNFLASITKGQLVMEADGLLLILPRILSIYGNPDFFAPYLVQFIPLTLAVAVLNPAWRKSAAMLTVLLIFALFLTQVWGAFISLMGLALVFFPLLAFVSGRLTQGNAIRAAAYAVGAGILFVSLLMWMLYTSGHKSHAIAERLVKYRMAAEMWKMAPVSGVGVNAYKSWYPRVQQQVRLQYNLPFEALGSSGTQENRTHNDFAQMLAETGVLGTGMFLWLMVTVLTGALKYLARWRTIPAAERANACGLMGGVLVILLYALPNFPFHIVSSAATFWVMFGLLASYAIPVPLPALAETTHEPLPQRPPSTASRRLAFASVATTLVMAILAGKLVLATLEYKRANPGSRQLLPTNLKLASVKYERAMALDFSNAQYAYDYGAMCFNLANTDPSMVRRAEELLKKALRLGFVNEDLAYGLGHLADKQNKPEEAFTWYSLAATLNERKKESLQGRLRILLREITSAEQLLGKRQYAKARTLYAEALERNPLNHLALYKLGTLSVTPFGELESGIEYLAQAARIAVNEPSYYFALGRALAAANRLRESQVALRRAAMLDPENAEIAAANSQLEKILAQSGSPAR